MNCGQDQVLSSLRNMISACDVVATHDTVLINVKIYKQLNKTMASKQNFYRILKSFIQQIESGRKLVAAEHNIPKSTLATWLKDCDKIKQSVEKGNVRGKKERSTTNDVVDKALQLVWFTQGRKTNTPADGALLLEKANALGRKSNTEAVSASWIERWKQTTQHISITYCW